MDGLTCFWTYEGLTRKLITKVKYNFYFDYLREFIILNSELLKRTEFTYFNRYLELKPAAVPIPLFEKRLKERGFNQAEVIAKTLEKQWGLDTNNLLVRVKDTGRQVGRTREERLKAMEGAFEINHKSQISNDKVLLVDDVWTTGATMREAAKVLKQTGTRRVWGLVLAR